MALSLTLCRSLWLCLENLRFQCVTESNVSTSVGNKMVIVISASVCVSCNLTESSNCKWWHLKCKGLYGCSGVSRSINWWKLNGSIDDMDVTIVKLTLTQIHAGWHKRTFVRSLTRISLPYQRKWNADVSAHKYPVIKIIWLLIIVIKFRLSTRTHTVQLLSACALSLRLHFSSLSLSHSDELGEETRIILLDTSGIAFSAAVLCFAVLILIPTHICGYCIAAICYTYISIWYTME